MSLGTLGSYDLLTCLAAGGMAEIYAARDTRDPAQLVIVKRMLSQFIEDPAFVEMFLDEGRTVSLLRHPNVVRMHYFGFEGDTPYLAMEYLHGVDVRAMIRAARARRATLSLEVAVAITVAVCAGLHHAHEARSVDGYPLDIVHRDVSPQNVFVTFLGEIKVIDFGIAKSRGRSHETRAGSLKGKVPYMSPEQIRGATVDRRSDLYAVGVMFYELVTGRRPYVIEDGEPQGEFSLMMAIVSHQIASPRTVRPSLPASIEQILLKALSAQPADRYQTGEEMEHALRDAARAEGLRCDARPLTAFLDVAFREEKRQWREAMAESDDELVTRIRSLDELRSSVDEEFDPTAFAAAELAALRANPPALASEPPPRSPRQARDEVSLIAVEPRLDERFPAAELAATSSGTVVFDLGRVTRISSFGLRQWLELQRAFQERDMETAVYLARCSEAVVAQLGLMRAFAEGCSVVSFLAPFACTRCGHALRHTFDCERDAAALTAAELPCLPCPGCGGPCLLDDDLSFMAPLFPHLGRPTPPTVRAALDRLEAADESAPLVEKLVEDQRTLIRITRPIDHGYKWARALEGLEGDVELELADAGLHELAAIDAAASALRQLDPAVRAVELVGAPLALARRLAEEPRCQLRSVAVRGRCPSCQVPRWAQLSEDLPALLAGSAPAAVCHRCASPLIELELGETHALAPTEPARRRSYAVDPAPVRAPTRAALPRSPSARPRWRWRWPVVAAVAALGLIVLVLRRERPAVELRPVEPDRLNSQVKYTSMSDRLEAEAYSATGSPTSADSTAALGQARLVAIRALIAEIETQLPADVRALHVQASEEKVIEHFNAQLGPHVAITRVAASTIPTGGATVRYAISRADLATAVAFYRQRLDAWGATWCNAPPTLAPGVIVRDSTDARWKVGDRLLSLDGAPVRDLDAVRVIAAGRGGAVEALLERSGARVRQRLAPAPHTGCDPEQSSNCARGP
ncbi:MAG: serine/threonine-protein kinase [Kofleriaceae bacterium]